MALGPTSEILNSWLRPLNFFLNGLRPHSHKFWVLEACKFLITIFGNARRAPLRKVEGLPKRPFAKSHLRDGHTWQYKCLAGYWVSSESINILRPLVCPACLQCMCHERQFPACTVLAYWLQEVLAAAFRLRPPQRASMLPVVGHVRAAGEGRVFLELGVGLVPGRQSGGSTRDTAEPVVNVFEKALAKLPNSKDVTAEIHSGTRDVHESKERLSLRRLQMEFSNIRRPTWLRAKVTCKW